MTEIIERLAPGRYEGSIDYPTGWQLEPLEILVDGDGNLESLWLELPGKPAVIDREWSGLGSIYRLAFDDGTRMHLREYRP